MHTTYRNSVILFLLTCAFTSISYALDFWSGELEATRGRDNPLPTGVQVDSGSLVSVQVSGAVDIGCGHFDGAAGAHCGTSVMCQGDDIVLPVLHERMTRGIVILRLDNTIIPIDGGTRTFASPHRGSISFYVNDSDAADNIGAFTVSMTAWEPPGGDADQDGINDRLEDDLLEVFAPRYFFHSEEDYSPVDTYAYLRESEIEGQFGSNSFCGSCSHPSCDAISQVPFYPEFFLDPLMEGMSLHPIADRFADIHFYQGPPVDRRVNPEVHTRVGLPWSEVTVRRNLGIYGHVAPLSSETWVIQYWQFFGYNDTPVQCFGGSDEGDHEGDWCLFEVYIDNITTIAEAAPSLIQKAVWYAHGTVALSWNRDTSPAWQYSTGCYAKDHVSACYSLQGSEGNWGGGMPRMHPYIYPEGGMHEFWPAPVAATGYVECPIGSNWEFDTRVFNDGAGSSYQVTGVPNLGEYYRPRLGTEIVVQFHGAWGFEKGDGGTTNPPGPTHPSRVSPDYDMFWRPAGPGATAEHVGQYDNSGGHGFPGSISNPHSTVGAALSAADISDDVVVFPGRYTEALVISQPITIHAPYGHVSVGE